MAPFLHFFHLLIMFSFCSFPPRPASLWVFLLFSFNWADQNLVIALLDYSRGIALQNKCHVICKILPLSKTSCSSLGPGVVSVVS